jgi:uncharacterized metal-binding protein
MSRTPPPDTKTLPLVYACSGCSSAAQLANHLAVRLDRSGVAEMSCIAGVGGGVRSLVRRAQEAADTGRTLVAIDGCVLACARQCLAQRGLAPTLHILLAEAGVKKRYHADFDPLQAEQLYAQLAQQLTTGRAASRPGGATQLALA